MWWQCLNASTVQECPHNPEMSSLCRCKILSSIIPRLSLHMYIYICVQWKLPPPALVLTAPMSVLWSRHPEVMWKWRMSLCVSCRSGWSSVLLVFLRAVHQISSLTVVLPVWRGRCKGTHMVWHYCVVIHQFVSPLKNDQSVMSSSSVLAQIMISHLILIICWLLLQ